MSFEPDNTTQENTIIGLLEQNGRLLAAILAGIALMNDLSPKQLLELSEDL
jgi:hypothetical protein